MLRLERSARKGVQVQLLSRVPQARVAQLEEATDSNPVQCPFESDREHNTINTKRR
jgi:hypothetical protein